MLAFFQKIRLKYKLLIFFLLLAIVPMLAFMGLFANAINVRMSERISSLLDTGILMTQNIYEEELERLAYSTRQTALYSFTEKYQYFLKTRDKKHLQEVFDDYSSGQRIDINAILNNRGEVVLSSRLPRKTTDSYKAMIRQALKGETLSSIEVFPTSDASRNSVVYMSVAPIKVSPQSKQVLGLLVRGKTLRKESSLKRLIRLIPILKLRIFSVNDDHYLKNYSTVQEPDTVEYPHLFQRFDELQALPSSQQHADKQVIDEMLNNEIYKSRVLPLHNFLGQTVGFLVVSVSGRDLPEIQHQNLLFLGLCLLLGLLVVILATLWFNRSFIRPMNELSEVSKKITSGVLGSRVSPTSTEPEIHHMVSTFNTMLDRLQENEMLRSTFVATLTHDLRTPLVAQKRALDLLEGVFKDLQDKRYASLAQGVLSNNEQLLELISKLLDAYAYEEGKVELLIEEVNLHALVQDCCLELGALAQFQQIELVNRIPVDVPFVEVDEQQVKRVFHNLIGNALKYIPEKSQVQISARMGEKELEIDVEDNGPGIRPEVVPFIFQRYFLGHRRQQNTSYGLGLYICRMIMSCHGGTITVESQLEKGTRFTLKFPYRMTVAQ